MTIKLKFIIAGCASGFALACYYILDHIGIGGLLGYLCGVVFALFALDTGETIRKLDTKSKK